MQKNSTSLLGQFLIGLAVATFAGTIIAPLSAQNFNPILAATGAVSALTLVGIALASSHGNKP
ncbi:hypothetical protein VW35_15980 [Devosia soli]|uniref:Uncharacterized protein n=1 Tax=Devosia soli TaxID=361041 RepID=A0A0F5L3J2_9HYPH|nr:hypothetical protein [Devosia soli]KKB76986.1 hypothetical protein VW35_15980 [Devosia soli]